MPSNKHKFLDFIVLLTPSFYTFLIADIAILITLVANREKDCDVPLSFWLLVSVLLSLPSSYGSYLAKQKYGSKIGLLAEVVLLVASFFWMALGTIEVSMSNTCQETNPAIWWISFVSINIFWCAVVGFIISSILITLAIMFFQSGRNPEF